MGMKERSKTLQNPVLLLRNEPKTVEIMNQSQKDLQTVLLAERVKSEQHRLNYEKLKALNTK